MPYLKQIFTPDVALTNQQMNQLEENIERSRNQHIGNEQPQETTAGVLWLDTSATPYEWKIYTGTDWLGFAKLSPDDSVAWGMSGDVVTDANDPLFNSTERFFPTTDIVSATWESVGPTGSGADNIWTAMDDLPSEVDWVEIRARATTLGTDFVDFKIWARKTGSSLGAIDATTVFHNGIALPGFSNVQALSTTQLVLPVDESNRFDMRWERLSGSSGTTTLWLVGYGYR